MVRGAESEFVSSIPGGPKVERIGVPGGWLYITTLTVGGTYPAVAVATSFVPREDFVMFVGHDTATYGEDGPTGVGGAA